MPYQKKDHDGRRSDVCLFCTRKAQRLANEEQIKYIREKKYPNYDRDKDYLPLGICNTCRAAFGTLVAHGKEEKTSKGASKNFCGDVDYEGLIEDVRSCLIETRDRGEYDPKACKCPMCEVTRADLKSNPSTLYLHPVGTFGKVGEYRDL